ncbi:hypothetical protein PAXRUDRAFT_167291, partial [Paxillus rubicundulus Ve08.2h10]
SGYAYDNFDADLKTTNHVIENLTDTLKHLTSGLFPLMHGVVPEDLCITVIFRATQVSSTSPEPTPDQDHFLRLPFLCFSVSLFLRSSTFPPSP